MTPLTIGYIGSGLLILLLFTGIPVGFAMGLVGFAGMLVVSGWNAAIGMLNIVPYTTAASYDLSTIPLFILMGVFCFQSGLSRDLYYAAYKWLGHFPGGLAIATIAGCAGFSAVSGSSMATAATMGTVSYPEMKRYGYDSALATGTIAAGGTLGILIPPSLVFIIYGIITEQPIGKLFMAGFIPGIVEAILYMITIYVLCRRNPNLGPSGPKPKLKEMVSSLGNTWGVLILFLLVIGGIYMGVFSPTEAGAIGAFGALLFALGKRKVSWRNFKDALFETGQTAAMILIIVVGAYMLGYFLVVTRLPSSAAAFISSLAINPYIVLTLIVIIYLILGCIMEAVSMVVITMPIFYPIIVALGFDPIWFGVICVIVIEAGMITPPVGMNVFVVAGIAKDVPMGTVFKGITPFIFAQVFLIVLLAIVPQMALILPNLMGG